MTKAPAFQMYADDWLGSNKIELMTPEEEGAYIHLLCRAWNADDCGLPDNDDELAILSRLRERWEGCSSRVKACFISRDGRLYNERLLQERKKQKEWRKKCSVGGKHSAKRRHAKRLPTDKGTATIVPSPLVLNGNSTSPSSSTSTTTKPLTTKNTRARFVPPTLEQVKERIMDKGYGVDADKFWNHYESNGWKVGRNPMKKWEAALAKWNSESGTQSAAAPTQPRKPDAATEASFAEVNRVLASQARREGRA